MADKHTPAEDGGFDWRRLATDRNVSHSVARALWEHARATSPGDPTRAEQAFHGMLEDAEAANATHEPGRETLVGTSAGARDPSSLGPGKWTRVLLEEHKPGGPAGSAKRAQGVAQSPAQALRDKLAAAEQASKHAAALLATSDPATIAQALRELSQDGGGGVLQKIMSKAGSVIERILDHRAQTDAQAATSAAPTASATGDRPASAAPPANAERPTSKPAGSAGTRADAAATSRSAPSAAGAASTARGPAAQPEPTGGGSGPTRSSRS